MKNFLLILPLVLTACAPPEPDVSQEAGARLFEANCASCHGWDGRGMGRFGKKLLTLPPDLTALSKENGGVFPKDYVMGVIDGFERRPHFSGAMPEFGEGDMGPTVIVEENEIGTPVPADLLALVTWLETIQQ